MIIAHLTDIHRSREVIAMLERLASKADMLIISGDVTTFAEPEYFKEFMSRVARLNIRSLYVPGNNDRPDFSVPPEVNNLDCSKITVSGIQIGGLGGSPPTPFNTPYEIEEEEIAERLKRLGYVDILITHTPPFDTPADRLLSGGHAGSRAVRDYIIAEKPKLVLCGHIHEAIAKFRLGDSLVINPGSAASGRYARISFEDEIKATLTVF